MAGQAHHFLKYSPQKIEYAMHRFQSEVARLYKVLDTQLGKTEFIAGEYSIADIAAWPWVVRYEWQGQKLEDFPHVKRWFEAVGARPAVVRGAAVGADLMSAARRPPTKTGSDCLAFATRPQTGGLRENGDIPVFRCENRTHISANH
jgi:hypothetical protein